LEQLCNDHRLFIPVPKSFVSVFHAESDVGVRYDDDDKVWIDGAAVNIKIYGIELKAAREFKYLGVYVNEFGNPRAHFSHRAKTFSRAVGAFWAGMAKIPAFSFDFLNYLWRALVAPVAAYGADVYAWNEEDAEHFLECQRQAWRRMLQVGGRAPIDIVSSLLLIDCVSITWRVQRMALCLRLFNSPAGTLQQIAFVVLRGLPSPWYEAAFQDLQVLLPDLILDVGSVAAGPLVCCSDWWKTEGHSCNARLSVLALDTSSPDSSRHPKRHIKRITRLFRDYLRQEEQTRTSERVAVKANTSAFSKATVLHFLSQQGGPPLHVGLGWVDLPNHRSAIAALLCGDLCLGRYAGNFFAKAFIPTSPGHRRDAENLGVEVSRVCIYCWHHRRQLITEGEGHSIFECPLHDRCRHDFLQDVSPFTRDCITQALSGEEKLAQLRRSYHKTDWAAFGRFVGRVRQDRRRLRHTFFAMGEKLSRTSYVNRRAAWRGQGGDRLLAWLMFLTGARRRVPMYDKGFWRRSRGMDFRPIDALNLLRAEGNHHGQICPPGLPAHRPAARGDGPPELRLIRIRSEHLRSSRTLD
jgi:hypothetical protein